MCVYVCVCVSLSISISARELTGDGPLSPGPLAAGPPDPPHPTYVCVAPPRPAGHHHHEPLLCFDRPVACLWGLVWGVGNQCALSHPSR